MSDVKELVDSFMEIAENVKPVKVFRSWRDYKKTPTESYFKLDANYHMKFSAWRELERKNNLSDPILLEGCQKHVSVR